MQSRALETQINTLLEAHPLSPVLTSTPGVGVRTAAVLARQRISVLFAMLRDAPPGWGNCARARRPARSEWTA
ncbi:hypothetical protein GCM10023220_13570 [Streptomyces ziwulingensis]|uniref:IS110 family transposase n=1 Tax=Streptomyces ziwulingensis TaxID=1045501 RepID=A0ABP9B5J9_9ACTN